MSVIVGWIKNHLNSKKQARIIILDAINVVNHYYDSYIQEFHSVNTVNSYRQVCECRYNYCKNGGRISKQLYYINREDNVEILTKDEFLRSMINVRDEYLTKLNALLDD